MTDITLLDGSMGQELVKRHKEAPTPLWSTYVMMENPDLVRGVHDDYFRVGATIATANSYALLRDRLEGTGHEGEFEALLERAADLAVASRDAHGAGRVAGAIGPLGASYRPDLAPDPAEAARLYKEIVERLGAKSDLLIFETVASLAHAEGALRGAKATDKPVWISITVNDDDGTLLRSGEAVEALRPILAEHVPAALLVNCSRPEAVGTAMDIVKTFGLPFGAYANGFTHIADGFLKAKPTVDALQARKDLGPKEYADFAMSWVDAGATIVGGCCEVGPDHIAELAKRLTDAKHRIV